MDNNIHRQEVWKKIEDLESRITKLESNKNLQKEVFLLEHGFYDVEIGKTIIEWVKDESSDKYNWLRNQLQYHVYPHPPYEEDTFKIVLSLLDMDPEKLKAITTNSEIRKFWFKECFPEFFEE